MLRLEQTCGAYPEQYDAYDDHGALVGYLRLRWRAFTVRALPTPGMPLQDAPVVYEATPEGDGAFEDHERGRYLGAAIAALEAYRATGAVQGYDTLAPAGGRVGIWAVAGDGEFRVFPLDGLVNTGSRDCTVALYAQETPHGERELLTERTLFAHAAPMMVGDNGEEYDGPMIVRVTGFVP